jgi:hypothetical protein
MPKEKRHQELEKEEIEKLFQIVKRELQHKVSNNRNKK